MIKEGSKVKVKSYKDFTGDYCGFYASVASPDKVYEVEKIQGTDVYVKDRINYFRLSSLIEVEDV